MCNAGYLEKPCSVVDIVDVVHENMYYATLATFVMPP